MFIDGGWAELGQIVQMAVDNPIYRFPASYRKRFGLFPGIVVGLFALAVIILVIAGGIRLFSRQLGFEEVQCSAFASPGKLSIIYQGGQDLADVDLTAALVDEEGKKLEKREHYERWRAEEWKSIAASGLGNVNRCTLTGTATRGGKKVAIDSFYRFGPAFIGAEYVRCLSSTDVNLTNHGTRELREAEVKVTLYFETGKTCDLKGYWKLWRCGEKKILNTPMEGKIERIILSGSAMLDGEKVTIDNTFDFR
jgi:hypothetical protein